MALSLRSLILGGLILITACTATQANEAPSSELRLIAHQAMDGDAGAQLLYGLAYLEGRYELPIDARKGAHWLRQSARRGNPYAALMLGKCYATGRGVEHDPAQAVRWWRQAGKAGNAEAQYRMGKAHLEGLGASKDPARAIYWLTKSAEHGNADAEFLIGRMYYEGYAVAQDKTIAKDWLSRAAARGNSGAINLLGIMKGALDLTTMVYQQSAEQLRERAENGDPQAAYSLGLRYESGAWDVNKDEAQALKWITTAAKAGNHLAMKTLADIYRHGELGTTTNTAQADEWDAKAAAHP